MLFECRIMMLPYGPQCGTRVRTDSTWYVHASRQVTEPVSLGVLRSPSLILFAFTLGLYTMHLQSLPLSLFLYVCSVTAHGAHEESQEPLTGDAVEYAQRHVRANQHVLSLTELLTCQMSRWLRSITCTLESPDKMFEPCTETL